MAKSEIQSNKPLTYWFSQWSKSIHTKGTIPGGPGWATRMVRAASRKPESYKDVARGFVLQEGGESLKKVDFKFLDTPFSYSQVDKKDESAYDHSQTIRLRGLQDVEKILTKQIELKKMNTIKAKNIMSIINKTYDIMPFQQRRTSTFFNDRCNTMIQDRISALVFAFMPQFDYKYLDKGYFSEIVANDAAQFIVGMNKAAQANKGVYTSISKFNEVQSGLNIRAIRQTGSRNTLVVHKLELYNQPIDIAGLNSLSFENEVQLTVEELENLSREKGDDHFVKALETKLLQDLLAKERKILGVFNSKCSYYEMLHNARGLLSKDKPRWMNEEIFNEIKNCVSWGQRRNIGIYPHPPVTTALVWKSTPAKIREYENANPDSKYNLNKIIAGLEKVPFVPYDSFTETKIMISTSSGAGSNIKGKNPKPNVRHEIRPRDLSIPSYDFIQKAITSNKKNVTLETAIHKILGNKGFTAISGSARMPAAIGIRDDVAKNKLRVMIPVNPSVLIMEALLSQALKAYQNDHEQYRNEGVSANFLAQTYFLYYFVAESSLSEEEVSVSEVRKMVSLLDYPSWDDHFIQGVVALSIMASKKMGPFTNISEEERVSSVRYLNRRIRGQNIHQVFAGNSHRFMWKPTGMLSGERYTSGYNGIGNYDGIEIPIFEVLKAWSEGAKTIESLIRVYPYLGLVKPPEFFPTHEQTNCSEIESGLNTSKVYGDDEASQMIITFNSVPTKNNEYFTTMLITSIKAWVVRALGYGTNMGDMQNYFVWGEFLNRIFSGMFFRRGRCHFFAERIAEKVTAGELAIDAIGSQASGRSESFWKFSQELIVGSIKPQAYAGATAAFDVNSLFIPENPEGLVPLLPYPFFPDAYYMASGVMDSVEYLEVKKLIVDPYDIGHSFKDFVFTEKIQFQEYESSQGKETFDLEFEIQQTFDKISDDTRLSYQMQSPDPGQQKFLFDLVGKFRYAESLKTKFYKSLGESLLSNDSQVRLATRSAETRAVSKQPAVHKVYDPKRNKKVGFDTMLVFPPSDEWIGDLVSDGKGNVLLRKKTAKGMEVISNFGSLLSPIVASSETYQAIQSIFGLSTIPLSKIESFKGTGYFSHAPLEADSIMKLMKRGKALNNFTSQQDILGLLGYKSGERADIIKDLQKSALNFMVNELDSWRSNALPEVQISFDRLKRALGSLGIEYATGPGDTPDKEMIIDHILSVNAAITINDVFTQLSHLVSTRQATLRSIIETEVVLLGRIWPLHCREIPVKPKEEPQDSDD